MEKVKLTDICRPKQWKTISGDEISSEGKYPVYGANGKMGFFHEYNHIDETLLIGCRGTCGTLHITEKFSYTNGNAMALDNLDKKANIKFLYYFFSKRGFNDVVSGGVQKQITIQNLQRIEIPLPSLATQQRIAAILDQADAIIQNNRAIVQKYDALTQSLFLDMFGDPVKNEKGWNLTKFSNVLTKIESGWSPVCENYSRGNEKEWAVLKLGAVSYGIYNPKENKKCGFEIPNSKIDCEVKQGNLLFTRKNTYHMVGKTAFVHETEPRLLLPDTIFRLVYNSEKANPIFLYYLLNHNKFILQIQSLASGTSGSMPNISKAKLLEKDLIFPSVELQNQFAERVAMIEAQKQQAQLELAKSEELFQSLLQRAFKGELN